MQEHQQHQLYTNLHAQRAYLYPRNLQLQLNTQDSKSLVLSGSNNGRKIEVFIRSVPEGISPRVNVARVDRRQVLGRMHVYSDTPLGAHILKFIDTYYSNNNYLPLLSIDKSTNVAILPSDTLSPKCNFYCSNDDDNSSGPFVEYRYFNERHLPATVLYKSDTRAMYKMILPESFTLKVIIMPKNFTPTSLKSGHLFYPDSNLLINIFSRYMLSGHRVVNGNPLANQYLEINKISIGDNDSRAYNCILAKFREMNISSVYLSAQRDQIVGYDNDLTVVVGPINDISV